MKSYLKKYKNKEPLTLVCVGDSTTSQEWCHPNWVDWMNFVFKHDPWPPGDYRKIINSGEDGKMASYFVDHFEERIAMYKPDLVILSLGLNASPTEAGNALKGLEKLFQTLTDRNIEIMAWSPYKVNNVAYTEMLESLNREYKNLCMTFNATYVDMCREFDKYDLDHLFTFVQNWTLAGMKPGDIDFLHCNVVGNQIIAQRLLEEFETNLDISNDWKKMGTMQALDLQLYLKRN